MGSGHSIIPSEDLDDYEKLTYLTKREILHAWDRWTDVVRDKSERALCERYDAKCLHDIDELKYNPFIHRLAYVFSSQKDGNFSFEDFLDLLSAMSSKAPMFLKAYYAFSMYDFDEDGTLTAEDLLRVLNLLTAGANAEEGDPLNGTKSLNDDEKHHIVKKVLEETDINGDGISLEEFRHLLSKCPDFITSFKISL